MSYDRRTDRIPRPDTIDPVTEMTFGSLFAGVGGFDYGLEMAGLRCVWSVELDEWRRRLLALRFPNAKQHDDVSTFTGEGFERPDVICGGFPCQDISHCGKGAGIGGKRSGLWHEYARIIRTLRPRFVIVENVAALLVPERGGAVAPMGRVLGDLAEIGYDAEWDCLPASAFGAYHERDRVFIVAYPARVDGRSHDLLEASGEWRASIQSGRLSRMSVATDCRKRPHQRLRCEPELDRLVRRIPGALDRLSGIGDSVYHAVAEWIGRRLMDATR